MWEPLLEDFLSVSCSLSILGYQVCTCTLDVVRLYLITTDFLVHVHDLVARGVISTSSSLLCTTDDQRLIREFKNISSHVITTDGLVMLTVSN